MTNDTTPESMTTPHPAPESVEKCPRCPNPLTDGFDVGGASRLTQDRIVRICGACCTDEAVRQNRGIAPLSFDEWPLTVPHLAWDSPHPAES